MLCVLQYFHLLRSPRRCSSLPPASSELSGCELSLNLFELFKPLQRSVKLWIIFTLNNQMLFKQISLSLCLSGFPEHMTLSDFRCHFQALSPPIMKRYASMFVSHDERKVRLLIAAALGQTNPLMCSSEWISLFALSVLSGGGGAAGRAGSG